MFVPSLALLRQFKDDWKKQESSASDYFCICSERDIDSASDSAETHIYELASMVTTDEKLVARLVKAAKPNTIIYSTYQSSPILAKALKRSKKVLDLIVCDEAHRTAGSKVESSFSLVLDDRKIPARKKIFMTATPRIVGEAVKARLGDDYDQILADMDNEDDYGRQLYRMSFAEAIKQEILVDYRVIAVGVSDNALNRAVKERRFAKGTTIDEIANHYAVEKVMREYQVGHVVSFHSTVKKASDFADRHSAVFPKTDAFHVNGAQATSVRLGLLQEFKNASRAIITNARCLTEGVDAPKIDCVYFSDSRNSKIDIVQASGRALRRSDGKKFGYIVVPIFHREKVRLEDEIESGSFKNLVAVVRAMADQDARLAEEIKTVIYGKGKKRSSSRDRIKIIGAKTARIEIVGFEQSLKKAIFSQVVAKSVVRWRPFDAARAFIHDLSLASRTEWEAYCKAGAKPADIPSAPFRTYGDRWQGWGDWLGTGNIRPGDRKYRKFEDARKFVRGLGLKSLGEWADYCNGKRKGLPIKPGDIPFKPDRAYASEGWISTGDWLGTGKVASQYLKFRSYSSAKEYVHSLGLKSHSEWVKFSSSGDRPTDIPSTPAISYGREWKGMGDWLGTGHVSTSNMKFRPFNEARC